MKYTILFLSYLLIGQTFAQETVQRMLPPYSKLVVHPYIDIELDQTEESKVLIATQNWPTEEVITELKGEKLHIYLKGAHSDRPIKRAKDWKKYREVRVHVFLGYQNLEKVSLKGDGDFVCLGKIDSDEFRLSIMGDSKAYFSEIRTEHLKATIMGDGTVEIGSGTARDQSWEIFGDGDIAATQMKSQFCKIRTFGEADLKVYVTDELRYRILGDASISYRGNPDTFSSWAIGERKVKQIRK